METLHIPSGNATLRALFHRADVPSPGPAALLVPGWPGGVDDVLGLGAALAKRGVHALILRPRGVPPSDGRMTFGRTLEDFAVAFERLLSDPRVDAKRVVVGGHSFGGGMALCFAAREPRVRRVISIAGTDHVAAIRQAESDEAYGELLYGFLRSTEAPRGPANFNVDRCVEELRERPDLFGLVENAPHLADRSILIVGGLRDEEVGVDRFLVPLVDALRRSDAADVTFETFDDDHRFKSVRDELASLVRGWLLARLEPAT